MTDVSALSAQISLVEASAYFDSSAARPPPISLSKVRLRVFVQIDQVLNGDFKHAYQLKILENMYIIFRLLIVICRQNDVKLRRFR